MCLALLALDKRFSNVLPRHPAGGPDNGRDIEARYQNEFDAFAAVGFVNQANDSRTQKTRIRNKFGDDVKRALDQSPRPKVFVFFTNVRFTIGEIEQLTRSGLHAGFAVVDIFDRERMRIVLDNADGLAARFQYLGIPLSQAEQATFFARWGDGIQGLISAGFGRLETAIAQILFRHEATDDLDLFSVRCDLNRSYDATEIGHFRLFCTFVRRNIVRGIFCIHFGASDRTNRMRPDTKLNYLLDPPGIGSGQSFGEWIEVLEEIDQGAGDSKAAAEAAPKEDSEFKWRLLSSGGGIGQATVSTIFIKYDRGGIFQLPPTIRMLDLDGGWLIFHANRSLAEKIESIQIFANDYKIMDIQRRDFLIDSSGETPDVQVPFSEQELKDEWVAIRPANGNSTFVISFAAESPVRLFSSQQVPRPKFPEKN